ncbi:hypothetical protein J3D49_002297 [Pseudomonas kilonensis]|nr:hypothetical protein [Pseudomonas kilonensis]
MFFWRGIKKTGSWWPVFFGLEFCGIGTRVPMKESKDAPD